MLFLLESFYQQYRKLNRSMPFEELKPILEDAYKKGNFDKESKSQIFKVQLAKSCKPQEGVVHLYWCEHECDACVSQRLGSDSAKYTTSFSKSTEGIGSLLFDTTLEVRNQGTFLSNPSLFVWKNRPVKLSVKILQLCHCHIVELSIL